MNIINDKMKAKPLRFSWIYAEDKGSELGGCLSVGFGVGACVIKISQWTPS